MSFVRGSKALVIGGGGFIGSHLVSALLSRDRCVRVMELPYRKKVKLIPHHENLEWVEGNFANVYDVSRALDDIDVVFHFVSGTQPQSSSDNPVFDIQSNLVPTVGLLEQMRSIREVPLIFISSGGTVYGMPQEVPIPESHPTDPLCSYGVVKLAIEKYLELYHTQYGINYRILRVANAYGPGQETNRTQGVIGAFLSRLMDGKPLEVWGDGTVVRDYVYVADICVAFLSVEGYQGRERVFNIGSGRGYSVLEIIETLERLTGKRIDVRFTDKRRFDVRMNVLDIRRARKELDWEPRTTLDDGLETTLAWMKRRLIDGR